MKMVPFERQKLRLDPCEVLQKLSLTKPVYREKRQPLSVQKVVKARRPLVQPGRWM
jgi:hypothetical protein